MKPVLVINSGSSTLKFAVLTEQNGTESFLLRGAADGVGHEQGKLEILDSSGKTVFSETQCFPHQTDALGHVLRSLSSFISEDIAAIGHRIVHGGPGIQNHLEITDTVLDTLEAAVHFAPLHIPESVKLIRYARSHYPALRQFACFDTAFHRSIPEVGFRYALPKELFQEGVRRYGFHGLSCESIVYSLGNQLKSRVAIAHLGNGSSVTAVKDGNSVDTSMGMTPTGGFPMGTRTGDLDPGVLLYIQRTRPIEPDSLEQLLNKESGLKALGGDSDMRNLQQRQSQGDGDAALAIEVFARGVAKTIASYGAVLNGLDQIVFAGGIGEHSAFVRECICSQLSFLGVALHPERNQSSQALISTGESRCEIRIVRTEEELQIARHVRAMLGNSAA